MIVFELPTEPHVEKQRRFVRHVAVVGNIFTQDTEKDWIFIECWSKSLFECVLDGVDLSILRLVRLGLLFHACCRELGLGYHDCDLDTNGMPLLSVHRVHMHWDLPYGG